MSLKLSANFTRMVTEKERRAIDAPFKRALQLRDEGDFDGAIVILSDLARRYPLAPVLGTLGSLYQQKGDWQSAIQHYRQTVALSPKSELASLGLFHSLLEIKEVEEALSEMKRFLSVSTSKEYNRLLAVAGGDLDEYGRRLRQATR